MLKVNEAQYAAIEAFFAGELAERITRVLFESFPEKCRLEGRGRVLAFVQSSIGRARALGAKLESDLQRFAVTEFVLGVELMREVIEAQSQKLLMRDGVVRPTPLIFLAYQAMFAHLPDADPPSSEAPVYEVVP